MFNYERNYSEEANQTRTEANIENTPVVRRISAPICTWEQLPICHRSAPLCRAVGDFGHPFFATVDTINFTRV